MIVKIFIGEGKGRCALGGSLTAFLENGEQRGPAWGVEKLEAVREVVRGGDVAEEGFFFLLGEKKESQRSVRFCLGRVSRTLLRIPKPCKKQRR